MHTKVLLLLATLCCLCGCLSPKYKSNSGMINGIETRGAIMKDMKPRDAGMVKRDIDEEAYFLTHPLSSFNIRNNVNGTLVRKEQVAANRRMSADRAKEEYFKAIWSFNNGYDDRMHDFAERHGKGLILPITNDGLGKIRFGSIVRWKCLNCGYEHSCLYMDQLGLIYGKGEVSRGSFRIVYPAFDELTAKCPNCRR